MIALYHEGNVLRTQLHYQSDNSQTVRAPVDDVADEYQFPVILMTVYSFFFLIAELSDELFQFSQSAVYVSDDIKRTCLVLKIKDGFSSFYRDTVGFFITVKEIQLVKAFLSESFSE